MGFALWFARRFEHKNRQVGKSELQLAGQCVRGYARPGDHDIVLTVLGYRHVVIVALHGLSVRSRFYPDKPPHFFFPFLELLRIIVPDRLWIECQKCTA